jgi:hypothetical protein
MKTRLLTRAIPVMASFLLLLHGSLCAANAHGTSVNCGATVTVSFCDAGQGDPEGTEIRTTYTCTPGNTTTVHQERVGACVRQEPREPERIDTVVPFCNCPAQ